MAGAGKKTFTAGEVLTASDTNTYLMEQTVMYFAGTAARASAIPTPSTGMTSYIGVTGTATIPQIETYTGSAWQTPYGLTEVANRTFSSVASASFDNVFTTAFDNYCIMFNITAASATNVPLRWYGRTSGSDVTATYVHQIIIAENASITGGRYSNSEFAQTSTSYPAFTQGRLDLLSPKLANKTVWETSNFYISNAGLPYRLQYGGYFDGNNSFDGISIFPTSGTFSGTIRIYGYRNS